MTRKPRIHNGQGKSLQQMALGKLNTYMQKNLIESCFMPYIKINSRWIKDLNSSPNPFHHWMCCILEAIVYRMDIGEIIIEVRECGG